MVAFRAVRRSTAGQILGGERFGRRAVAAPDPDPVVPDDKVDRLVTPKAATPLLGSRTSPAHGRNCEGFRALAYETLQCRNPRSARAGLWVKRFWDGLGRQTLVVRQCSHWPDRSGFVQRWIANDIGFAGHHTEGLGRFWAGHAPGHRPGPHGSDRLAGRAMPDHGVCLRAGSAGVGGARGWYERAKASIMVMCPPQHGHGGRWSGGSSGSGSSIGAAMPSSLRASAMASLCVELASRP